MAVAGTREVASGAGIEIERKFLIRSDAWRDAADTGVLIRQGYVVNGDPSLRVRLMGDKGFLTVKAGMSWRARREYEYEIPAADAKDMLDNLCQPPILEKRRHRVTHGDHVWEIDVFAGANAGFKLAEVELAQADEAVEIPAWAGPEVTDDPRFFNAYLARRPFSAWGVSYAALLEACARR